MVEFTVGSPPGPEDLCTYLTFKLHDFLDLEAIVDNDEEEEEIDEEEGKYCSSS
jgi:hypothetical protein